MIFWYVLGGATGIVLGYVLFLCVCALLVDPRKEYENHSNFYRFILDSATAVAMKLLRIRVHVSGGELVPRDEKVLFVCNHRSNYDPIVTWYAFRKNKIAFISKAANFKIPVFGRLIRKCCFMAIDRENPRNAILTIQKAARLLQNGEVCVGVYPEGTRSKTGVLLPFHNGVFKIAKKAGVSVVVLHVSGTERIAKRTPFRATDVRIKVLDVITSQRVCGEKTDMIGAYVRRLMENETERNEN